MPSFIGTAPWSDGYQASPGMEICGIQLAASISRTLVPVTFTANFTTNATTPDSFALGTYTMPGDGTVWTFIYLTPPTVGAGADTLNFVVTAGSPSSSDGSTNYGILFPPADVFYATSNGKLLMAAGECGAQIVLMGSAPSSVKMTLVAFPTGLAIDMSQAVGIDLAVPFSLTISGQTLSAASPSATFAGASTYTITAKNGEDTYSTPAGDNYAIFILFEVA